jgi:large subunit ribosomal protein L10
MPNLVNRLVLQELQQQIRAAEGLLVLSFGGLTVKQTEGLRNDLAKKGCELRMVRNSLARIVLAERGYEVDGKVLAGNTAIAFGSTEATIHAAKALTTPEVKKVGKVSIRAGVLEGRLLGPRDATSLANVPDRKTLNGQILGCLVGPPRGIVGTLNAVPAGLVRLLQARADQLAKTEPAPAQA